MVYLVFRRYGLLFVISVFGCPATARQTFGVWQNARHHATGTSQFLIKRPTLDKLCLFFFLTLLEMNLNFYTKFSVLKSCRVPGGVILTTAMVKRRETTEPRGTKEADGTKTNRKYLKKSAND